MDYPPNLALLSDEAPELDRSSLETLVFLMAGALPHRRSLTAIQDLWAHLVGWPPEIISVVDEALITAPASSTQLEILERALRAGNLALFRYLLKKIRGRSPQAIRQELALEPYLQHGTEVTPAEVIVALPFSLRGDTAAFLSWLVTFALPLPSKIGKDLYPPGFLDATDPLGSLLRHLTIKPREDILEIAQRIADDPTLAGLFFEDLPLCLQTYLNLPEGATFPEGIINHILDGMAAVGPRAFQAFEAYFGRQPEEAIPAEIATFKKPGARGVSTADVIRFFEESSMGRHLRPYLRYTQRRKIEPYIPEGQRSLHRVLPSEAKASRTVYPSMVSEQGLSRAAARVLSELILA